MKIYRNENDGNGCDIETKKNELEKILIMKGSFGNRGQLWVNLTDDNGYDDDQVDRDTLILLKKLVQPITKQEKYDDNSLGLPTRLHLKLLYFKQKCRRLLILDMRVNFHHVFIFLMIVVLVLAVLFHLVAKNPA
jgi:hypothetical protein